MLEQSTATCIAENVRRGDYIKYWLRFRCGINLSWSGTAEKILKDDSSICSDSSMARILATLPQR
jgi:hypothetical protein